MATERGIVIKVGPTTAWVRTTKSAACEGCTSKHSCTAKGDDMEVEAINEARAQVGDRIVLSFATGSLLKATFLLYVFPILCMIVGAVIGQRIGLQYHLDESAISALLGFLCFFMAVFFVKFKGNRLARRNEYRPKIIKII